MNLLSRLRKRLLDRSSSHSESTPHTEPTPSDICGRCQELQLLAHIERPWEVSTSLTVSSEGFSVGVIDTDSINESCSLCTQFSILLQHPALGSVGGTNRSIHLWACHFRYKDEAVTRFYVPYHNSNRVLHLLPTQPMAFHAFDNGSFRPLDSQSLNHDVAALVSGRTCDPISFDCSRAGEWVYWCNVYHRQCGLSLTRRGGMRPRRIIDCKRRQLVDHNGQPYVCLSYVWGSGLTVQSEPDSVFPNNVPSTIADAIAVTLKVGLRYLWVDRYCIDQDNTEEKHSIIRNMNSICKSSVFKDLFLLPYEHDQNVDFEHRFNIA
jgi:hypothetical protein